jgi:hypothetical protein
MIFFEKHHYFENFRHFEIFQKQKQLGLVKCEKTLFYLKNSKSEILQKVLPRFVVLSSTKI